MPNALERFSHSVERSATSAFYNLGVKIHDKAKYFLVIPLLIALVSLAGLSQLEVEYNPEKLYTPQDSQSFAEKAYVERVFGNDPLRSYFFAVSATNSPNILTKPALLEFLDVYEDVVAVQGVFDGEFKNFTTACFRSDDGPCQVVSVLDFWDYDRATLQADPDVLATINNGLANGETYQFGRTIAVEDILGGVTNTTTAILSAEAFRMEMLFTQKKTSQSDGQDADPATLEYQRALAVTGRENGNLVGLSVYSLSDGETEEISGNAIDDDVALLPLGYIILTIFAFIVLSRRSYVHSFGSMAFVSIACIGLSIGACFSIVSALGVTFSTAVQALAFMLLGLGIDDTFVLMCAHGAPEIRSLPHRERMGKTLATAGISITITSVTDVIAFFTGTTSDLPAIQQFCIFAAVGILFDYILQITSFMAALVFATRREENKRADLLCCIKPENPENEACSTKKLDLDAPSFLDRVFGEYVPKVVLHPVGKVTVLAITVVLLGCAIWAAPQIQRDFNIEWFIPDDSYLQDSFDIRDKYFGGSEVPFSVFTQTVDYPNLQPELESIANDYINNRWVESCQSWFLDYKEYIEANHAGSLVGGYAAPGDFYTFLREFLDAPQGERYGSNLKFTDNTRTLLEATKTTCFFIGVKSNGDDVDGEDRISQMDSVRNIASSYPELEAFAYNYFFLFLDGLEVISQETLRNILIAGVAVFVLTLVLLASLSGSLIVFAMLALVDLNVLAVLYYSGLDYNSVTAVNLVIAVGLAIDSSVHMMHAFLTSEGTNDERARIMYRRMGRSVWNGSMSTFLAILPLALARSYIFQVFFTCLSSIVLFAIWHGAFVLPVIVSLVGPPTQAGVVEELNQKKAPSRVILEQTV